LRDLTVFEQVKLDREAGNLVWPGGADFDPETLHDWPERKAAMLAAALRWRKGEYAVTKRKSGRVSAVYPTQGEAIKKASELSPKVADDERLFVEKRKQGDYALRKGKSGRVERIRDTKTGERDKWRKP